MLTTKAALPDADSYYVLTTKAALPDADSFVPALHLIIAQRARHIWRRLGSFEELDLDGDGELTRAEVRA